MVNADQSVTCCAMLSLSTKDWPEIYVFVLKNTFGYEKENVSVRVLREKITWIKWLSDTNFYLVTTILHFMQTRKYEKIYENVTISYFKMFKMENLLKLNLHKLIEDSGDKINKLVNHCIW